MSNKTQVQNIEQKNLWTNQWENSRYSLKDKIDGNKSNSVKYSRILPYILQHVEKNDRIVEAGCGMGQWVVYLSDEGYDITGIDYSESTILGLQANLPNYNWEVQDITNFTYNTGIFDVMLSWGVVEHFEEGPSVALLEASRVIKEGGLLFVTVPCKEGMYLFLDPIFAIKRFLIKNKFVRKLRGKKNKWQFLEHHFRRRDFERYVQSSNFDIIETVPISHESGLIRILTFLFRLTQNSTDLLEGIIYKNDIINNRKQYSGLTSFGQFLKDFLYKISPWITPSQLLVIARKKSEIN